MWLLILASCTSSVDEPKREKPRENVLFVVIDTLRADAVARAETPVLDALAKSGDSVDNAWSSSTWTVPSMISMFTGMPVRQHGWNREPGNVKTFPTIPKAPMLAEVLKKKGYTTTALYANDFLDPDLGFDRGFDTYKKIVDKQAPERVAQAVNAWKPGEKNFLYVHLLGPHSPLQPSEAATAKYEIEPKWIKAHRLGFMIGAAKRNQTLGVRDAYREAYHAVVEDADARLGEILATLGDHRDNTLIVVTSDHGELLGEHNICGHGWWVYDELTHVPLLVEGGVPLPETLSGASIPALITESLDLEHTWPTAHDAPLLVSQRKDKLALSVDGRTKAIWTDKESSAFDLDADPEESTALPIPSELAQARTDFEKRTPAGTFTDESVDLHPETIEALKALGYMSEDPQ